MTDPLPSAASGLHLAEKIDQFKWDGNAVEPGIGLAVSGGGFRAMLFHAGALLRLNELGVLSRVARISSVSGGSIAAGYLAFVWSKLGAAKDGSFESLRRLYVEPMLQFSREKIDVSDILSGLLPWSSAADKVVGSYQKLLFGNATLQDLPDEPRFVFCATNLQTGVLWRFSKPYAGDYLVGRLDKPATPLAQAVAASSAFPPFLSPLALTLPQGSFTDWPQSDSGARLPDAAPYRGKALLSDGGVYDNHGLEPIVKRYMTVLVSDGGAPFEHAPDIAVDPIRQLQRVYDVTDNQVRALRRRDIIARFKAGSATKLSSNQTDPYARLGAYWGIDTSPAKVNPPDALACATAAVDQLAHLHTRLSDLGETPSKQLINWGYAICDRCIRINYNVPELQNKPKPQWPYPEAPLA